jgi:Peptidase family M23
MAFGLSRTDELAARTRMPLVAAGLGWMLAVLLADLVWEPPTWLALAGLVLFACGMALYLRLGTPHGRSVDIGSPVRGRWQAFNSPSSRVPSHGVHGWSQTYAVDLVLAPGDGSRPGRTWWPLARRPEEFPGFGSPVLSPVDGTVVHAFDRVRDHWSRTSPPALLYLVAEGVRELAGPPGVVGNHVVVERDDGLCVLLAHLRRSSVGVARGDRVRRGDRVGECGNSGNSTEPHLHVQVMDRPSPWVAAGLPFTLDGEELPRNGGNLATAIR